MFPTEGVPERIGSYRVIRRLSGGGGADVYLGKMEGPMGFQRQVALKLVPYEQDYDPRLPEELAREASICSRLNHPAIVKVFDFFEHENRLVLVLEHIEGVDLDKLKQHLLRRNKRLADDAVYYLAHQIGSALAHAHAATDEEGQAAPVIDRNLNPENVLIGWDGQVRITGFGLGKILGRSPESVVGTVRGTPGYMSPEQTRGERVTTRADVYAFGMIAWSLLAQRHPPIDGTRPHKLAELRQDIPREIAAAIDASLEQIVDKRKITCAEMEAWLEKIVDVSKGRSELRDKARLLRSKNAAEAAAASTRAELHGARQTGSMRRRVSVKMVRPSEPPPSRMPLQTKKSQPPPKWRGSGSMRAVSPLSVSPSEAAPASTRSILVSEAPSSVRASPSERAPSDAFLPRLDAFGPSKVPVFDPPPAAPTFGAPPPSNAPAAAATTTAAPPIANTHAPIPSPAPTTVAPFPLPPATPTDARPIANEATPFTLGPPQVEAVPAKQGRPLTALETIAVAAFSAALVVIGGIYFFERGNRGPTTAPSGPYVVVMPPPTTTAPAATATSTATAEPASTVPLGRDGEPDASRIEDGYAVLTVTSTVDSGYVYLNGTVVGPANQPLRVACGRYFVRIGSAPGGGGPPTWLALGQSAVLPCKRVTKIESRPPFVPLKHR